MRTVLCPVAAFAVVALMMAFHNGLFVSASRNDLHTWISNPLYRKIHENGTAVEASNEAQCSMEDIQVTQGETTPQPSGIPTYRVEITNTCENCYFSKIHLNCGSFTSAILINPRLFKHLSGNDCLVNDGKPLKPGGTISFEYATTFKYPLSVASCRTIC